MVVVGVDCIVVNGDIVNKIGIYSLVLLVFYYGVFFYVVVLLIFIDIEMEFGKEIIIEERLLKEFMYLYGGVGF